MERKDVRVIAVPKGVTIALLVVTTAAMLTFFGLLSRHAYVRPAGTTAELIRRLVAAGRAGTLTEGSLIATLWPVAANLLVFVPWGFLAFIAVDRPQRPRRTAYAAAILGAIIFASAVQVWDTFMPMRVTSASDVVANALGAFCGA